MKSKVVIKFCATYDVERLEEILAESLALIGGVSAFFKQGQSVLLKPNLLTNADPEKGVTTHPHFVQAVVKILKNNGLKLAIADIPGEHGLEANPEKVYKITGIRDIAKGEGVELLTKARFIEEDGVIFSSWVREFDHLVSLPKFKTHSLMTLTGAVKNIFGLTPRLYRINLHKRFTHPDDFAKMLLGVYRKCKPTLSFVDGIVAMEGNGPAYSGILRKLGLVAVSDDAVALDSILACVMGLRPEDIPTNQQARLLGLGETDLGKIEIKGDDFRNFLVGDFKLPPTYLSSLLPKNVLTFLLTKFAQSRPRVNKFNCDGCRICVENCPLLAIEIQDKKASIDYRKCVDCFCCLEVCPKGAMKIKSGPLSYVIKFILRLKDFVQRLKLDRGIRYTGAKQ